MFSFQPHLFNAATLPWETTRPKYQLQSCFPNYIFLVNLIKFSFLFLIFLLFIFIATISGE